MKDIIIKPGAFTNKIGPKGNTPGTSLENYIVNLLKSPTCCAKYISLTKANYTQVDINELGIESGVATTTPAGEIATLSLTTAANTTAGTFTVSNPLVKADSLILANIVDYTGTTGFPAILIDDVVAGSFKVTVRNIHNAAALNGVVGIGYAIM